MSLKLSELIESHKIFILCGTGGVGKTTVSASVALYAAEVLKKKTLVITIDPAKRLKTALGLSEMNSGIQKVSDCYYAFMPKSEESFKHLIESLTQNDKEKELLSKNKILKSFSNEYSGANEYFALNELMLLHESKNFDFIVLDTPPSQNTISFLRGPRTIAKFFEEKIIKLLVLPTHSIFSLGLKKGFSLLSKITGEGFIQKFVEFCETLITVQDAFLSRLKKIHRFLQSDDVAFFLVSTPTPEKVSDLKVFLEEIENQKFNFKGLFLNKSLSHIVVDSESESFPDLMVKSIQKRELECRKELSSLLQKNNFFECYLPELNGDIKGLEDLKHVVHFLNLTHS